MNIPVEDDGMVRLVEVTRGLAQLEDLDDTRVESSHRGALAVVDSRGQLLASAGNPLFVSYMRSAAKPFQALPLVAAQALERFHLGQEALALVCASHHGTEEHVAVIQSILDRINLGVTHLRCGSHWPIDPDASRRLAATGGEPDARHNNCSGKHAGMLALARHWNCWQDDYTQFSHPVQQAIRQRLCEMAGLPAQALQCASDGCSVPTFALPLANAALAYARLVAPEAPMACQRVVAAMQAHPHLVSGHGALDDLLLRAGRGRIVSKGGAEGYQGIGVRTADGRSVGIALKIEDGNPRGKGAVVVEVLAALALVDPETLERLESQRQPPVTNHRSQTVGEIRAAFTLQLHDPPLPTDRIESFYAAHPRLGLDQQ